MFRNCVQRNGVGRLIGLAVAAAVVWLPAWAMAEEPTPTGAAPLTNVPVAPRDNDPHLNALEPTQPQLTDRPAVPIAPRDDELHLVPPQVVQPRAKPPVRPTTPPFPGTDLFNDQPPFLAGVTVNHDDAAYMDGDKLIVEFKAEREAYLYLLYHQADGSSLLLFPNEAQTDNHMPAKKPVLIPPPLSADSKATPFRFRVRPPFGTEVLQVLASTKPVEELSSLVKKTGRAAPVAKDVLDGLQKRLAADLSTWTEHRMPIKTAAKAAEPPARKAARVGLFFGVNKYKDEKTCEPHEEFRRSAELMHQVMTTKGQVDPEKARLITGEDATRAAFEEAVVKWLPSVSQPGDTVFLFYAGHGGQVTNLDGSEPDLLDEHFSTYDNELGEGIKTQEELDARIRKVYVLDDTLARWLQELPGRQIVLMMETCHGGGINDAKGLAGAMFDEGARVKDISQLNTIIITGCGPDESVWFTTGDNIVHPMPRLLVDAIEKLPHPVTVRQAYEHYRDGMRDFLRAIFTKRGAPQEPTFTDNALLPVVLAP